MSAGPPVYVIADGRRSTFSQTSTSTSGGRSLPTGVTLRLGSGQQPISRRFGREDAPCPEGALSRLEETARPTPLRTLNYLRAVP